MNTQPVLTIASVQAVLGALLSLLLVFGVDLSKEQVAAIIGLWVAAGPIVFGLWARSKVTPV